MGVWVLWWVFWTPEHPKLTVITLAYILSSLFDPDSISVDGVAAMMGSHVELLL